MTTFDPYRPTVQLLGRFQPWHKGHRALFERALAKTGQVVIEVRTCPPDEKNVYDFPQVKAMIEKDLVEFTGEFKVIQVPNIVNITYGRDVGYTIEQEHLGEEIEAISATKIRAGK